jgi:hypothetical protein
MARSIFAYGQIVTGPHLIFIRFTGSAWKLDLSGYRLQPTRPDVAVSSFNTDPGFQSFVAFHEGRIAASIALRYRVRLPLRPVRQNISQNRIPRIPIQI